MWCTSKDCQNACYKKEESRSASSFTIMKGNKTVTTFQCLEWMYFNHTFENIPWSSQKSRFMIWSILLVHFPPAPLPPITFHWYIHWYINMTGALFYWYGAHSWKAWFTSHGGITQSKGWLCQKWKLSDIMGTHLHLATQLSKLG